MIHAQDSKSVIMVAPGTISSGATASARVDTLGFAYCTVDAIMASSASNSSTKWSALKVLEGDTTTFASASAIVALTGTTNTVTDATNGYVIQTNNDTTGQVHRFCIRVGDGTRKRHLFVVYQGASSNSTVCIKAELSRAAEMPNSDTERGVALTVIA